MAQYLDDNTINIGITVIIITIICNIQFQYSDNVQRFCLFVIQPRIISCGAISTLVLKKKVVLLVLIIKSLLWVFSCLGIFSAIIDFGHTFFVSTHVLMHLDTNAVVLELVVPISRLFS